MNYVVYFCNNASFSLALSLGSSSFSGQLGIFLQRKCTSKYKKRFTGISSFCGKLLRHKSTMSSAGIQIMGLTIYVVSGDGVLSTFPVVMQDSLILFTVLQCSEPPPPPPTYVPLLREEQELASGLSLVVTGDKCCVLT